MRVIILLSLAAIAASQPNYQLEEEWRVWKILHGKNYQSDLEELERHLIWLSNVEYVNRHNEHAEFFGFTLAMNHFGDMVSVHGTRLYMYIASTNSIKRLYTVLYMSHRKILSLQGCT